MDSEMTQTIEQLQARVALISQERNGYMEAADRACDERDEFKARVRELEEENARLHEQVDLQIPAIAFKQLTEQLAASQAYAEQLRVALTTCVCAMQDYQAGIGITEMFDKGERLGRKALALPRDTSALDAYVAEKVKEHDSRHVPEKMR